MANSELRIFPSHEQLSRQAAKYFAQQAREQLGAAGEPSIFSAALSGGSTPRRLYELLADPALEIPWERVHLFQVDERCVPPDHPESNYRMIREALLDRAPVPMQNFHRMAAEVTEPEEASRLYAAELSRVLGPVEGCFPRLDLVVLGMGSDGHTASLFPGSPALEESRLWVRADYVARLRADRITLTFPVLNAAAQVIFLVAGAEKAETLRRVLEGPAQPERYPVQRIDPTNDRVIWFVDALAASLLKGVRGSG